MGQERENSLVLEAKRELFRAQLDELKALAVAAFRDQFSIGAFGVKHCTRCGAPVLVGLGTAIRTKECERECV